MGIPMGMGIMMNPHGPVGILYGYFRMDVRLNLNALN